jgi:LysR family transcriptional regulator, regulator for bpeEF and oprC
MKATFDIGALTAFVTVVRSGSFTKAADILQTQKAHLSRVVTRLETQLRVRLLQRSTRSLALTEAGRELFERAGAILAALEETQAVLENSQSQPQGLLRLTCGEEFGTLVVNRWISTYLQRYPKVRIEVELTNRVLDIVHEGFDIAIRVGTLPDSALSARKLGEVSYGFYASPRYLRDHKLPQHPDELKNHELLMFSPGQATWLLVNGVDSVAIKATPRLKANNNLIVRDNAAAGLGIALLPNFQAAPLVTNGQLKPVLKGWGRAPVPVHAVFASSRFLSPKVRAFVDHARGHFESGLVLEL